MRTEIILPAGVAIALTSGAGFYAMRQAETVSSQIAVTQAWAQAMPPGSRGGAVYLTIENRGPSADRLLAVTSPAAQSATLCETATEDSTAGARQANARLAPGATLTLTPSGAHIVLLGLDTPLNEGGSVDVTLKFQEAGRVKTTAKVRALVSDRRTE
jgi:copper(I)-binding protein